MIWATSGGSTFYAWRPKLRTIAKFPAKADLFELGLAPKAVERAAPKALRLLMLARVGDGKASGTRHVRALVLGWPTEKSRLVLGRAVTRRRAWFSPEKPLDVRCGPVTSGVYSQL